MILTINKILRFVARNKRKQAWAQSLQNHKQHFAKGKASTSEEDLCPYHSSAPMGIPLTYGFICLKDAAKVEAESLTLHCKLI